MSPVALAVASAHGLWGNGVDRYEVQANDVAARSGGRTRSVHLLDEKDAIWIVSEPFDPDGVRPFTLVLAA